MKFSLPKGVDKFQWLIFFALRPHACEICGRYFWLETGIRKMFDSWGGSWYAYRCVTAGRICTLLPKKEEKCSAILIPVLPGHCHCCETCHYCGYR